jgi:hypothetical protein
MIVNLAMQGRLGWALFTILLIGLLAFAWFADTVASWFGPGFWRGPQLAWVAGLVLVMAGVVLAGKAVNGRWSGAFIDSRNRYSLSQVQAIAWLVLVSSGIVAAGIANVRSGVATPLDLSIPIELLAAIGLSVTTLVGTPLIRSIKRGNNPDPVQTAQTMTNMGMAPLDPVDNVTSGVSAVPPAQLAPAVAFGATSPGGTAAPAPAAGAAGAPANAPVPAVVARNEGTIVALTSPQLTGWADLVRGEETGNSDKLDLGKLQLLYVTSVAILVYGALMFTTLGQVAADGSATLLAFPGLDDSFVGILGLSHIGGLAYQAAPHAKTQP